MESLLSEFAKVREHFTDEGLGNKANFELNMITQYLLQILGYYGDFTRLCILTEFSLKN